jgi:hypothetical protein
MKTIKLYEEFLNEKTLRAAGRYKVVNHKNAKYNHEVISRAETLALLAEKAIKIDVKDLVIDAGTKGVTQVFIRFSNGLEFVITDKNLNLGVKSTKGQHKEWVDEFVETMKDLGYETNRFSAYDNSRVEVITQEKDLRSISFYKKVYDSLHKSIFNANIKRNSK